VDRQFGSCNFSFILRGTGNYVVNGQSRQVQAPCVFIQQPATRHQYGPDESWEEFSLLYSPDARELLRQRGFLGGQPLWPITNPPRLLPLIEELITMLRGGQLWSNADRADRLADLLLFESQQQRPATPLTPAQERVRALFLELEANPAQPTDLPAWIARCGLSESSFRRAWATFSRRSPADHHQHLRLRQACRLLIETSLTIAEISEAVGYEDPLYFSRLFARKLGVPPSAYRRQQTVLSQTSAPQKTTKPDR
jgi:AraC-like DNA-binding protein